MRLDTIIAYTYRAELLCSVCVIAVLLADESAAPAALDMEAEEVLDQIAGANAIDRHDEWSFDSDDFPKVVHADSIDGENCDGCGCPIK